MNLIKKIIIAVVLFFCFCFNFDAISANDVEDYLTSKETSHLEESDKSTQTPRSIEYKWIKHGKPNHEYVDVGYARGQPEQGIIFKQKGGFYWTDGGQKYNYSVNFGYGPVSIGIAPGTVMNSNIGYYIESPYLNVPVKLKVTKKMQSQKYAVYKKDRYSNFDWVFDRYDYGYLDVQYVLDVVQV